MNGFLPNNLLLLAGAGLAVHKITNASTGKTDRVGEPSVVDDLLTTNGTSDVISKMRGCFKRITEQELLNNRGISSLFGQTGETRKANTLRYLINHDKSNITGELDAKSKKDLLVQAEKAMQYSRQAEHLFCLIAKSNGDQSELINAKRHCEDLLYLYTQRDKLSTSVITESEQPDTGKIVALSKTEEKLTIINARIDMAEAGFKKELNAHLKKDDDLEIGYNEFLEKFQLGDASKSKYQIEDFIRFYAFKVKLMEDDGFRNQVKNDFRKYIFSTSVGHLDAGEKLAYQYGKWIKDLLDESSLGDIDSQSGNISQYFMQTVYNLLNVGDPTFSLSELCIGDNKPQQRKGLQHLGSDRALPGSYYLDEEGVKIVKDIVTYYNELAPFLRDDNLKLASAGLEPKKKKTLIWNLVGGTHDGMGNKTKKGIFYRIDEQLRGFISKTESAVHNKLVGFQDRNSMFSESPFEVFISKLPPNPYRDNPLQPAVFQYNYSIGQNDQHIERLNVLQRIAARCRLNDLGFPDRQDQAKLNQLRRLKTNYQNLLIKAGESSYRYENYFKDILKGDFSTFTEIEMPANDDVIELRENDARVDENQNNIPVEPNQIDEVLTSGWEKASPDLAGNCIESAKNRNKQFREQNFKLVLPIQNDVNTHLQKYENTITALRKNLEESDLFKDMKEIIVGLDDLRGVIKFYNSIIGKEQESKEVGLLATPAKLVTLAQLAVINTKDQINGLYKRYQDLNAKYSEDNGSNDRTTFKVSETEIFEFSFLKTLFEFIGKQSKDNSKQSKIDVDLILKGAVDTCIQKLGSMKYITLATDTINALNSKRLLMQLTQQKTILIQFARVFSIAGTDANHQGELENFHQSLERVIADLEIKYKNNIDKNGDYKAFNELCLQINAWLLKLFINKGEQSVSTTLAYIEENGNKHNLVLSKPIAKSIRNNYDKFQNADFTCEQWNKVSEVHKTLLENLDASKTSIVSKMTLYLGQLFSDGFSYNPDTKDRNKFRKLIDGYQSAVMNNLAALNAMGYMHQELLGHYSKLIGGVEELFVINTTVALRSKLLMELLNYTANRSPDKKFVCVLTDEEKQLYLQFLHESNLYQHARNNQESEMELDDNQRPVITNFQSYSPDLFADPSEVVRKLLEYLNTSENGARSADKPLTDYAVSTEQMIDDVEKKSKELHLLLAENKNKNLLHELNKGIQGVGAKLKSNENIKVNKDTVDSCNELLSYFEVEAQGSVLDSVNKVVTAQIKKLPPKVHDAIWDDVDVKVTQVNTLHLADLFNDIFNSLYNKSIDLIDSNAWAKTRIEFKNAHEDISLAALCCEIALFENITTQEIVSLSEDGGLIREVLKYIKEITSKDDLASIEKPLDYTMLFAVYKLCSENKSPDEKKLIQAYLNAFQYKKIDQCLAKFYISANNNLPTLATNLTSLYELAGALDTTQAIIEESNSNKKEMEKFIINSNVYLKNVNYSIFEWKSLIAENSLYAWLIQPKYDALESNHRHYFEWFTKAYLKFDMMNSGAVGPLRDELQFMVILEYLKVYKGVENKHINEKEIELIKRFYHSPKKFTKNELTQIRDALKKVDTFLTEGKNSASYITSLFTDLQQYVKQLVDWFIREEDALVVKDIKQKMQDLYNMFYLEIIKRGEDTLVNIAAENARLDKSKESFKAICSAPVFKDLSEQFKEVKTAGQLYGIFRDHAVGFNELSRNEHYSTMLNFVIDGIKARNLAEPTLKKINMTFINDIISDHIDVKDLSEDQLVQAAEKVEVERT